jgi:hypothetical protein
VPISTLGFSLGVNGTDPATYAKLKTPSGVPFHAIPKDYKGRIKGGFSVFATPVKGHGPDFVYFIIGCRSGGKDVTASLSASCVFLEPAPLTCSILVFSL